MFDDVGGTSAEASSGAERACQGTHNHVDLRCIDILCFCDTSAGPAEDSE
jgi:hypothetical protein